MPHRIPPGAPPGTRRGSRLSRSRGLRLSSGENGAILGVVREAPDHARALCRRERPVEIGDELREILVPAPVLAKEFLGAARLRPGEHFGELPAELLRLAVLLEQRDELALQALPVLEAQRGVALVGRDEAPDAGLLLRGQLARKVAQALEHALALRAQALLFVGGEKFLGGLFFAFCELALEHRKLRGPQRREHRRRILGGFRREPAVARAQIAQSPRHVFRRDAVRGPLACAL